MYFFFNILIGLWLIKLDETKKIICQYWVEVENNKGPSRENIIKA